MFYTIISLVAVLFLIVLWYIFTANNFVEKNNRVKQCSSGICVALKQRNDMIPNLVASVKAYAKHENETLTKIVELRSKASGSVSEEEQINIGNEMSKLLPKLNIMIEDYPELKANSQFEDLQNSIENIENEIQAIRRTYNAAVTDFNNYVEMFPSSIVASRKGHKIFQLIDILETEKANVDVKNLFG